MMYPRPARLALSRNQVQKFHPTVILCASPRLTSSSRSRIAASKAETMLSLSLLITSGQAVGSEMLPEGRLTWTQLSYELRFQYDRLCQAQSKGREPRARLTDLSFLY